MDSRDFKVSKYYSASDWQSGERRTLTIRDVNWLAVQSSDTESGEKPAVWFREPDAKILLLNATRLATLQKLFGYETSGWLGQKITLHPEDVPFKGKLVPSLKIAAAPVRQTQQPAFEAPTVDELEAPLYEEELT